ncbi:hypothetical protein [Akkermansia glycaniphila]|uniref:Sodium:solute symporter family n=1 Tax=Akkermansia glycaniphila TaxID=1679444 RepID=A0A1H6M8C6_9BACT|nr:hypothetical protein [Akkermansia glycaniphila]SEH97652.1 Hypothetical protein PYTT_2232 [Akkermansia glycaniphila]
MGIVQPRKLDDALGDSGYRLDKYFLGDRSIIFNRISELLISASFGANAILYSVWLGYIMGVWAIFIHLAWCVSFILLGKFVFNIYHYTSLHDFLGSKFGRTTRIISALCSIIGIVYFTGWEIAITLNGVESLASFSDLGNSVNWPIITTLIVMTALFYTVLGGVKANSIINPILNAVKLFLLCGVVCTMLWIVYDKEQLSVGLFVPDFDLSILKLGVIAFITNIIFNLSWQFVDNSSWQTISSSNNDIAGLKKLLPRTSIGVLFAYILGTILGVTLRVIPDLNSDNILGNLALMCSSRYSFLLPLSMIVLLLFSMMSLVDGLGLSVSQTIMVDLRITNKCKKVITSISPMQLARFFTILSGIFAAWGVSFILNILGINIFDFVYIFIVIQLSLLGPVLVGLLFKFRNIQFIWVSIVISCVVGISANVFGGLWKISWLLDAAGTITTLTSILVAFSMYWVAKSRRRRVREIIEGSSTSKT